jgi:hypothetical protein
MRGYSYGIQITLHSIDPNKFPCYALLRMHFGQRSTKNSPPYRTDLINAAMGARRLTNKAVAEKAGVGVMTVSKIRNGDSRVGYMTLKKVVEALGLTIAEVSEKSLN